MKNKFFRFNRKKGKRCNLEPGKARGKQGEKRNCMNFSHKFVSLFDSHYKNPTRIINLILFFSQAHTLKPPRFLSVLSLCIKIDKSRVFSLSSCSCWRVSRARTKTIQMRKRSRAYKEIINMITLRYTQICKAGVPRTSSISPARNERDGDKIPWGRTNMKRDFRMNKKLKYAFWWRFEIISLKINATKSGFCGK